MNWRPPFLFLIYALLTSCSGDSVEQIDVQVPLGVTVPASMVYIPAGEFVYGHRDDPKTALGKKVFLKAYLIDRYEVSREAYREVNAKYAVTPRKKKFPVTRVTFAQAESFCKVVGKRLPSEMEWEKAARGTDGRKWPWKLFQPHPNNGYSGFIPEAVDKRREWISPYGVYGMGHNVWEWVAENYDYNGMPATEQGKYRVLRGGLYQSHLTIKFSATWARNFMEPLADYNFIGFRCARDVG